MLDRREGSDEATEGQRWPGSVGQALSRGMSAFGVHFLFHGMRALGRMPMPQPRHQEIERFDDICYGDESCKAHHLDVWRPAGSGEHPALLYLHGGGFRLMSRKTHWMMAEAFARRGFVVFSVDYRLAPEHPFPSALIDAARAACWVAEEGAARFGADIDRLVVAGESAGGNLALGLGLMASVEFDEPWARDFFRCGPRPAALLPGYGVLQVSRPEEREALHPLALRELGRLAKDYLPAGGPQTEPSLADPLLILEQPELSLARPLPPCLAQVGALDPLRSDSERLQRAWRRLGGRCELGVYEGCHHGFNAFLWRDGARQSWIDSFAFLDRALAQAPEVRAMGERRAA